MGLLGKITWTTVAKFLTPGKEKKFNGSHKSFSRISSDHEYVDVSNEIIKKLHPPEKVPWRFFKHSESGKLFAENVDEKCCHEFTAMHRATIMNLPQVARALIEAGVDVNAKNRWGETALHYAAFNNHLQIGRMLIDAGAGVRQKMKIIGLCWTGQNRTESSLKCFRKKLNFYLRMLKYLYLRNLLFTNSEMFCLTLIFKN